MDRRIKLPNDRAYERAGSGDHSLFSPAHCCVCGKKIENAPNWLLLTRAEDGTAEFAIAHPLDAPEPERMHSLWVAPIGPDCLRKHPELAFAELGNTPKDDDSTRGMDDVYGIPREKYI